MPSLFSQTNSPRGTAKKDKVEIFQIDSGSILEGIMSMSSPRNSSAAAQGDFVRQLESLSASTRSGNHSHHHRRGSSVASRRGSLVVRGGSPRTSPNNGQGKAKLSRRLSVNAKQIFGGSNK